MDSDKIHEKVGDTLKSVKINKPDEDMREVSVDFLKSIKSLMDVVNTRIHWKTNELLPVGVLMKQIDELI